MKKQKAQQVQALVQEITDNAIKTTGRDSLIFLEKDSKDSFDVKVFERNTDGSNSTALLEVVKYSSIAKELGITCFVKVEFRDGKGTKGCPYFLFF